jgi:hypothetical protein
METRAVPSLSDDGWVLSSALRANYLMSHFFLSEYSQTSLYPDQVSSLPYIIQQNQGNISKTSTAIRSTLAGYLTKYFNDVNTQVDFVQDEINSTKYRIRIYVTFTDNDGITYNLGKLAVVENSKISSIADLNNNGPVV